MRKYIRIFIILLAGLVSYEVAIACAFTINKTVIQPTCGSNGLINISLTPPPTSGARFKVYQNGLFYVASNGNLFSASALAPGVYKVVVTDIATGCVDSIDNIVLDPATNALSATHYIDSPRCDSSTNGKLGIVLRNATYPVTYSWRKNNVPFVNNDSVVKPAMIGDYSVTVTDASNCRMEMGNMIVKEKQGKMMVIDTIIFPTSCDSPNGSIEVKVVGNHLPEWKWVNRYSKGDSLTMPLDSLSAGRYSVIFTDTLKCYPLEIKDLEVVQNSKPEVIARGMDTLCPDVGFGWLRAIVTRGDTSGMTYLWNNGLVGDSIKNDPAIVSGNYSVIVTDRAGCKDTANWTIQGYPAKPITIVPEYIEVVKNTQQFLRIDSPKALYNIVWRSIPENKFDKLSNKDSVIRSNGVTENTTYIVSVNYGPGCKTEANITIKVIEKNDVIKDENIPNIFTPLGPTNATYKLKDLDNNFGTVRLFNSFEFKVYDRWGNIVFSDNKETFEWKGTDPKGNMLTNGVYTYFMKYTTLDAVHDFIERTGAILLER